MMNRLNVSCVFMLTVTAACKKDAASDTTTTNMATVPAAVVTTIALPSAPQASAVAIVKEPEGPVAIQWMAKSRKSSPKDFDVAIQVGKETFPLGVLDGTTDDSDPSCRSMKGPTAKTSSAFGCGGTPAYHFYTAALKDGAVVVTLTTGVDGNPSSERVKEVKRVPTAASALEVKKERIDKLKKAAPTCAKGTIMIDGTCVKECASDSDCSNGTACEQVRDFVDGTLGSVIGSVCQ